MLLFPLNVNDRRSKHLSFSRKPTVRIETGISLSVSHNQCNTSNRSRRIPNLRRLRTEPRSRSASTGSLRCSFLLLFLKAHFSVRIFYLPLFPHRGLRRNQQGSGIRSQSIIEGTSHPAPDDFHIGRLALTRRWRLCDVTQVNQAN